MGRKRREAKVVENVLIERAGAEGKAIAHVDGKVVFVPFGAPGDIATLSVKKSHRKYMEGNILELTKASEQRTEPFCEHYGLCGGCKWQHLDYQHQLGFKAQQVYDNLTRIGKLEFPEMLPIVGSEDTKHYRNKLEYTASDSKWLTDEQIKSGEDIDRDALGYHMPGRFDRVFHVNTCHLQDDLSNQIRNKVFELAKAHNIPFFNLRNQDGVVRTLMIRNNRKGEWMVLLALKEPTQEQVKILMEGLKNAFPQIVSLHFANNDKRNDSLYDMDIEHYSGAEYLTETLDGLEFRIRPKSFFQTNPDQAEKLYQITRDFAGIQTHEVVYDLYTGTGTIACYIAKQAKKVVGIEYVEDAIADAKLNAADNKIENCSFYAGDMKDVFTDDFVKENGQPDVIITDPPRAGMHQDVVDQILKLSPERVVYVSCNPATQARDLALMSETYNLEKVQPVDMFPHTHHVENVVLLRRK